MAKRASSRKRKRSGRKGSGDAASGVEARRLQAVLAAAGAGSRRKCEELILAGRVEVDGKIVTELGTRVDPDRQKIRLDGATLEKPKRVYYALNKPPGVVCTNQDPSGRARAVDLIPKEQSRLFTVGRLDMHSEGLILLTNDGQLADRLTHPRYGVNKTYRVLVAGHPTRQLIAQIRRGVHLAEGIARVAGVRIKKRYRQSTLLEMVLAEGRNREIRRVLARAGHKVLRLVRVAIGPLRLDDLASGVYRRLRPREVAALRGVSKEAVSSGS
ncbi:MAG: pseudouridine synthase [Planctomycetota bacterium]|jgi:23S rRNA pseudouridine2605 synthase